MTTIRPKYYLDKRGHDMFWHFEHGYYPAVAAISFCYLNMLKYEKRAGQAIGEHDDLRRIKESKRFQRQLKLFI